MYHLATPSSPQNIEFTSYYGTSVVISWFAPVELFPCFSNYIIRLDGTIVGTTTETSVNVTFSENLIDKRLKFDIAAANALGDEGDNGSIFLEFRGKHYTSNDQPFLETNKIMHSTCIPSGIYQKS